LIKQPDERDVASLATLRTEAAFYRFCAVEPAVAEVWEVIPRLADHDPERAVLVLELVRGAVPLASIVVAPTGPGELVRAGQALGHALGTLHRVFRGVDLERGPRLGWLHRDVPWALTAHQPEPDLLASLSPANAGLLRILQDDESVSNHLDALRAAWRRDTLIHGDVKFDNVLVLPGGGVRVVDWEMVQIGDAAYDLAGALQDHLLHWTYSMPVTGSLTPAAMIDQASRPLSSMRGAIRVLWYSYRAAAGLDARLSNELLRRAVSLSAARLILSTYEISYEAERLSARSLILLQLAANVLAEPERAQVELYGIPQELPF
jgi:hypothetical protein